MIANINKKYEKHRMEIDNIIQKILFFMQLENTIKEYVEQKNAKGHELEFLELLIEYCQKDKFNLKESYEYAIEEMKKIITNDHADYYNKFVEKSKLIYKEVKEIHDEILSVDKEKIEDTIKEYIEQKNIKGYELEFLELLIKDCQKDKFNLKESHEYIIEKMKKNIENDDDYDRLVKKSKSMQKEIEAMHDKKLSDAIEKFKDIIKEYIKQKNIKGYELEFLEFLMGDCQTYEFDLEEGYEYAIEKMKKNIENDYADYYNKFIKKSDLVLKEIKEMHNKELSVAIRKLDDIYKVIPTEAMKSTIREYKTNISLLNKDEGERIYDCLDTEKEREFHEPQTKKKQIEQDKNAKEIKLSILENKLKKLDNRNYFVPIS